MAPAFIVVNVLATALRSVGTSSPPWSTPGPGPRLAEISYCIIAATCLVVLGESAKLVDDACGQLKCVAQVAEMGLGVWIKTPGGP